MPSWWMTNRRVGERLGEWGWALRCLQQDSGRQQDPHFVLLLLLAGERPPPLWLGSRVLPVAQAQPGAHPSQCGVLLVAARTERKGQPRKAGRGGGRGQTAGNGCAGGARRNSRTCCRLHSPGGREAGGGSADPRPQVARSTWSSEDRGRDGSERYEEGGGAWSRFLRGVVMRFVRPEKAWGAWERSVPGGAGGQGLSVPHSEMLGGDCVEAQEQVRTGKAAPGITMCIWNWKQAQMRSPGCM